MAISSETRFLWKVLLQVLLTPYTLFLMLLGRATVKELLSPFSMLFEFLFEPRATITLVLLTCAAFIASAFIPGIESLVLHPGDILTLRAYTLITAGFLHASIAHLAANMLALFVFGRVVERSLGAGRTLLVYFGAMVLSGLFASVVYLALHMDTGMVGASGAIMGLVAAAVLLDPLYLTYSALIPLPIMVLGWLALLADFAGILGPADGIAHYAHLGGFLSVSVLVYLLRAADRQRMRRGLAINVVSALLLGAARWYLG